MNGGGYPMHQNQDQGFGRNYGHHRHGYHQHGNGQYGGKYKYQASSQEGSANLQKMESDEISYGG